MREIGIDISRVLDYAVLAQQAYEIGHQAVPPGWVTIAAEEIRGRWSLAISIYANIEAHEIVIAFRGTQSRLDLLNDIGLFLQQIPAHQEVAERIVRSIVNFPQQRTCHFIEGMRSLGHSIYQIIPPVIEWLADLILISTRVLNLEDAYDIPSNYRRMDEYTLRNRESTARQRVLNLLENISPSIEKAISKIRSNTHPHYTVTVVGHSLGGVIAELCAASIGIEAITFESPGTRSLITNYPPYNSQQTPLNITTFLSAPNVINTLDSHLGNTFRLKLPHTESYSLGHITACILQEGGRIMMFGSIPATALKWVFSGIATSAVGSRVASSLIDLWRDKLWLQRQHSIDNIIRYLNGSFGRVPYILRMNSWPTLRQQFESRLWRFLNSFIPLRKDQPGLRTIFDEEGMREAQIAKIPGYEPGEEILITISHHLDNLSSLQQRVPSEDNIPPGLEIIPIVGDGHCLYHAIAQCTPDQNYVSLRNLAAGYIENHWAEFGDFFTEDEQRTRTVDGIINDIRFGNRWGDEPEIRALTHQLRRPIIIIRTDGGQTIMSLPYTDDHYGHPIFILYNGLNHYNALVVRHGYNAQLIYNQLAGNLVVQGTNDLCQLRAQPVSAPNSPASSGVTTILPQQPESEDEALDQAIVMSARESLERGEENLTVARNIVEDAACEAARRHNP
ncbi:MAG TPA: hypothetical protein VMV86_03835 [Methanosarcinales archaeon]|nr:hypothetical protein [Methanosarcinales archaeon]